MNDLLSLFTVNPLTTYIGRKVEAATRPDLEQDDWTLNMEICDLINDNFEDAKDAARSLRKRFQQCEQERNFQMMERTLTLLDTCVANCSNRFHALVMTRDFMQGLVKLIGPKVNPPIPLQEKVLGLIERWAVHFRFAADCGGVVSVYNDLKAKGVIFPQRDPENNVPIQTPPPSVPPEFPPAPIQNPAPPPPQVPAPTEPLMITGRMTPPEQQLLQPPPQAGPITLEGDAYNKIWQDLTVVSQSIEMFTDVLKQIESNNEESDWQLADSLNSTCGQMETRIVDLIERVANEDLIIELLKLNDELNSVFEYYQRLILSRGPNQATSLATGNGGGQV